MLYDGKDKNGRHVGAQLEFHNGQRVVRLYRGGDSKQKPKELVTISLDEFLSLAFWAMNHWRNEKRQLELPPEAIEFLYSLRGHFEVVPVPACMPRTTEPAG